MVSSLTKANHKMLLMSVWLKPPNLKTEKNQRDYPATYYQDFFSYVPFQNLDFHHFALFFISLIQTFRKSIHISFQFNLEHFFWKGVLRFWYQYQLNFKTS